MDKETKHALQSYITKNHSVIYLVIFKSTKDLKLVLAIWKETILLEAELLRTLQRSLEFF